MFVRLIQELFNSFLRHSRGSLEIGINKRLIYFGSYSIANFTAALCYIFTFLFGMQILNYLFSRFGRFVIRVFGREQFQILAGIKAENLLFGVFGADIAPEHGEVGVAEGIFALTDLYGRAATSPSIRREIERPERVGGWQRGAVQNRMILTHAVVLGGAVLEVVTVAVGLNLLPARGHEGSADGVVIFRVEVIVIIAVVYRLNIFAERFKGFNVALVRNQGQPHLAQCVVSLEAGENKSVVFERMAHSFGDLMGNTGVDAAFNLAESFGNKAPRFGSPELRGIEAAGVVDHTGSVKKGRVVKIGARVAFCEAQQVIAIQIAQSGVKREI